jgi:hypothetical protein
MFSIPDAGGQKAEKNTGSRIHNTDTWAEPEMLRMADVLCDSSAMLPLQLLVIKEISPQNTVRYPHRQIKFYNDTEVTKP